MHHTAKLVLLIVVASVATTVATTFAKKASFSGEDAVVENLKKTAERINREGPRLIGNGLRLDGAIAGPGRSITYFQTNLEATAKNVDKNLFETTYAPTMRANVCKSMTDPMSKNVLANYTYKDRDGNAIGTVSVSQSDCK